MKQHRTPQVTAVGHPGPLTGLVSSDKQAMLRPASACVFIGVSRTALHRLSENDPSFPRKIVISKRCVGYRTEALEGWLLAKESSI
jgi:predicted DNA-binding transcriptional regulator AlpA